MRDIRFRAWDGVENKMLDMSNLKWDNGNGMFLFYIKEPTHRAAAYFRDFILMQFTGLKDKNGKEIYEGDVLLWQMDAEGEHLEDRYVVESRDGYFIEKAIGGPGSNQEDCFCEHAVHGEKIGKNLVSTQVIGNIYSNPELLKGNEM